MMFGFGRKPKNSTDIMQNSLDTVISHTTQVIIAGILETTVTKYPTAVMKITIHDCNGGQNMVSLGTVDSNEFWRCEICNAVISISQGI